MNIDINRFQSEFENVFKDSKKIAEVVNAVKMLSELGHNCGISQYGFALYPICYSETPYNATEFVKNIMGKEMLEKVGPQISSYLKGKFNIKSWEISRSSLIKKTCHMYDEEWRIMSNCQMKEPAMIEWIPNAVILGLRTSKVDENLIISMAEEAGIKKIYKSYIDWENQLNTVLIKNI